MIIDLQGKLPPGSGRLRLSTAFEIHWDQASLFERADSQAMRVTSLLPDSTDLHWRGFSEFEDLPWYRPLTPDYDKVQQRANWRITPEGWCTRYGDVKELIAKRDDALALLNGGDELTLSFAANRLPEKPAGHVRDFFLFTVGWDKDADFHVARSRLSSRCLTTAWTTSFTVRWIVRRPNAVGGPRNTTLAGSDRSR